jgi:hypothetical protein
MATYYVCIDETRLELGENGYLNPQVILRRELYPAVVRAGVPRRPTGEKRTFHSPRHTYARLAIETTGRSSGSRAPRAQFRRDHERHLRPP